MHGTMERLPLSSLFTSREAFMLLSRLALSAGTAGTSFLPSSESERTASLRLDASSRADG